jgi:hypothetical protein
MGPIIILVVAFISFGFYLCRALITERAEFFRGRPVTPKSNPAQYWGFVAIMGTVCAVCLLLLLI